MYVFFDRENNTSHLVLQAKLKLILMGKCECLDDYLCM